MQLECECTPVWNDFLKGHFVTQKTYHKFSMMAHDQIHEQLNAIVKGDGGVIGITENESALRCWMIAGPETARVKSELSTKYFSRLKRSDCHHEQIPSIQNRFATNVRSVVDVFNEMGNPFTETSSDLLALDTKIIMADEVIKSIKKAEDLGKVQYKAFVEERMVKMTKNWHHTKEQFHTVQIKTTEGIIQVQSKKLRVTYSCFQGCTFHARPEKGRWMHSLSMKTMHAWPPSLAENNNSML